MNNTPVLAFEDLALSFGDDPVLDRLSFALRPGERVALLGESGCGKSTAALCALGLLPDTARVTAGRVRLAGTDLLSLPERPRRELRGGTVALVPQEAGSALNPVVPVARQVAAVLRRVAGLDRRTARARATELFEEVGLADARVQQSRPHELSGGQCQRAMIAMALGCEPRLLIADEPSSALDVTTQARVMERLTAMTGARGTTLLLITHDLALMGEHCERGLVMYCGRIVESGTVDELLGRPAHPYTAGLLAAVPRLRGPRRRVRAMTGSLPEPGRWPPGCRFEPRCPRASIRCREERPEPGVGGAPGAACFHPHEGPYRD